jgi:hypothetical protein
VMEYTIKVLFFGEFFQIVTFLLLE